MTQYWPSTAQNAPAYPRLESDLEVEVAIVGAGIVGLTLAELLTRAGLAVAVLEARRVGRQATGNSTAKITSQHGLLYDRLSRQLGDDLARAYGAANEAAIRHVEERVGALAIDCGFERLPAYVYATDAEHVAGLEAEAETAARLGLPASFTREPALPFAVAGAVRFAGQAQFNPVRYLDGLAAAAARGAHLFEQTRVTGVEEGEPCVVRTEQGTRVTARAVVVATQMPTVPDGMYFAKAHPVAHPMAAARIDADRAPAGMFISSGEPSHSFRVDRRDGETWLVAVGGSYKPGHPEEQQRLAHDLEAFLERSFGIAAPEHRWTNEDFSSIDGVPFVGRVAGGSGRLFVATGFNGWGISNGTAAALLLSDLLQDRANPWSELYDATRLRPLTGGPAFVTENLQVGKHFLEGRLFKSRPGAVQLAPGEGAVVERDGEQLALSRAADGSLQAVSAICSHLGCVVGWNPTDRTWDCPCHGSRFEADGSVLCGPATAPLERKPAD